MLIKKNNLHFDGCGVWRRIDPVFMSALLHNFAFPVLLEGCPKWRLYKGHDGENPPNFPLIPIIRPHLNFIGLLIRNKEVAARIKRGHIPTSAPPSFGATFFFWNDLKAALQSWRILILVFCCQEIAYNGTNIQNLSSRGKPMHKAKAKSTLRGPPKDASLRREANLVGGVTDFDGNPCQVEGMPE